MAAIPTAAIEEIITVLVSIFEMEMTGVRRLDETPLSMKSSQLYFETTKS